MRVDHMLMVVCAYLLLILTLALLMRFRSKPFQVRAFATVHNLVLTLLSLYMLVEILRQAYVRHYSLFGNGVEHGFEGYGMARILHIFYLSKTLEFIDTVIMCLKKNFHQITFLHVTPQHTAHTQTHTQTTHTTAAHSATHRHTPHCSASPPLSHLPHVCVCCVCV